MPEAFVCVEEADCYGNVPKRARVTLLGYAWGLSSDGFGDGWL